MINKNSKIVLTYQLGGTTLQERGIYKTAEVYVKNSGKNEVFKVDKPMQTIKQPVYKQASQIVTLNSDFVQSALERPEKPKDKPFRLWSKEPIGKVFLEWRKLSSEQKLEAHIKQYVLDMGGEEYSYEII